MQVWRQVSHPVRSSLPLLFIRSHSVKRGREREMEEEDMVRSRKPLALPPGWQGREGRRRMAVACVRVRVRARDFGNAMISGTN